MSCPRGILFTLTMISSHSLFGQLFSSRFLVSKLAELFMERFHGLERAHGVYPPVDTTKEDGKKVAFKIKPSTKTAPVTIELWDEHLSGNGNGLGIVPINDDNECRFGAIDIDEYNLKFDRLGAAIKKLKLPLIICRTKSGGAHLYLFLSDWCPASLVRSKLQEWALKLGYPKVEIFPKQNTLASRDDTGNWINMPYYNHTSTDRYAILGKRHLDSTSFLDLAESREIPPETLASIKVSRKKEMLGAPPCLETIYDRGESKFRNNAIYNFAVYCIKKFGDGWEKSLEDFNQHCMNPPLASDEISTIVKSIKRKQDKYFYKCQDQPICDVCNKEVCLKRKYGVGGGKELNVELKNLRKLTTDPPIWIVDVNGKGVTLNETSQLISPQAFTKICVETVNIMPNGIKLEVWREIINDLLKDVEIIEAPSDAGIIGEFLDVFTQWIINSPRAKTRDEILLDHPWYEDGAIYFRTTEMRKVVAKQCKVPTNMIWAILREHFDAKNTTIRIKGVPVKVWVIKEFEQQTEEYDLPEVPEM